LLFFLEDASINPFICADAKVSVYAIRSKKALELLVDLCADFARFRSAIFPFIWAEANVSVLASRSNILGETRRDEDEIDG